MNKIKQMVYYLGREYTKKSLTNNLGRVVEEDDKLICYVKKRNISKKNYHYNIYCHIRLSDRKLIQTYQLDKPICYVLESIKFDRKVFIYGDKSCEIIIQNCQFPYGIFIRSAGKCVLDNNQITGLDYTGIVANNLTLKNMNIDNRLVFYDYKVSLGANDKLELIDSTIGFRTTETRITASNELNLINSQISGKYVECETANLQTDNHSGITSQNKVTLNVTNLNTVNITSPTVIYNGQELHHKESSIVIKTVTDPVKSKRLDVIRALKEVRQISEQTIQEEITKLSQQPIKQLIRK